MMGYAGNTYIADSCPNCGKEDAARMGDTRWGHSYHCCSDKCGMAFGSSTKRYRMDIKELQLQKQLLDAAIKETGRKLDEAFIYEFEAKLKEN